MRTTSQTLDVLELLEDQHTEVDQIFERLEAGDCDRSALFLELADKLAAHTAVEEKIFYPAVMQNETADLLHESVEEHLAMKRLLSDMLALDPVLDQVEFDAKLAVLKEEVAHHAHEEEEDKLFPMLRASMTEDELAAIGNELLALFEALIDREPHTRVPGETAHAAELPPLAEPLPAHEPAPAPAP